MNFGKICDQNPKICEKFTTYVLLHYIRNKKYTKNINNFSLKNPQVIENNILFEIKIQTKF